MNPLKQLTLLGFFMMAMSPAWAQESQNLRAVDKDDTLAPGTSASESVMKSTTAQPLEVGSVVVGEVISKDPAKKELTIKEDSTSQNRTLSVINTEIFQTLQNGDRVRITIPAANQTGGTVFKS